MARIFLQSLGCDKNTVDAERMAHLLKQAGHELVAELESADCAVINTCGFIESAKREALDCVFDAVRCKQAGSLRAVVVTGCLAQRYTADMAKQLPEADAVVALADGAKIAEIIECVLSGERWLSPPSPPAIALAEGERARSGAPHVAYLKIADGCDNFCTFCAIPYIRGKYQSRKKQNVLDEARTLAAQGVKELILIAQDTTRFGSDTGEGDIADLIWGISEIEGIEWIRLLYAYPDGLTQKLTDCFARCKKLLPYIDLPLQHCSTQVLKRMGRHMTDSDEIVRRINALKSAVPDIAVRTTFIAGFPGETAQQFSQLCEFVKQNGFSRAGCFAYSREEGTAAARLDGQVRSDVRRRRADSLNLLLYELLLKRQQSRVGQTLAAICDGYSDERGKYVLRTVYDAPDIDTLLFADSERELACGDIVNVSITAADGVDLVGIVV